MCLFTWKKQFTKWICLQNGWTCKLKLSSWEELCQKDNPPSARRCHWGLRSESIPSQIPQTPVANAFVQFLGLCLEAKLAWSSCRRFQIYMVGRSRMRCRSGRNVRNVYLIKSFSQNFKVATIAVDTSMETVFNGKCCSSAHFNRICLESMCSQLFKALNSGRTIYGVLDKPPEKEIHRCKVIWEPTQSSRVYRSTVQQSCCWAKMVRK